MNEADRNETVEAAIEPKLTGDAMEDSDRFEQIFRRYQGLVYRAAYRITGNASDAEDILQTVFLRLIRRGDTMGEVAVMESYLYRAAVNAALDLVRTRQHTIGFTAGDGELDVGADSSLSPDRVHFSDVVRTWLRSAVAKLSPMASEAFVLRFFEGKGNVEIAEILETTPSTVAVTLHRARQRLQKEFRADLGGFS